MNFTVPDHSAAVLIESKGYRQENVGDTVYYTTTDDKGRTVIGPRRHRVKARPSMRTRKTATLTQETPAVPEEQDAAVTTQIILEGEEAPAEERKGWRQRLTEQRWKWRARLQDKEWHETARHCAVTSFTWVALASLSVIFVKVAVWVVTL